MKFAHLHQHTQYSLLDGAAKLDDLFSWVRKVSPEDPTLAITDHGNMYGAVRFYKQAKTAGVKPIIGYEAYVAAESRFDRTMRQGLDGGYFHLTILAKDFKGYQNLSRLASRAYLEGFYMKPRIDRALLREHNEGLIVLSGCLGAEVPQFILQDRPDLAEERLLEYLSIFKDRYFVEIQDHGLEEDKKVIRLLVELANKHGIGMVVTNDGHYVTREDAKAHEVLLAIQSKSSWEDPNRWRFPCNEFYVKSPEEMREVLPQSQWGDEIFDNTQQVADLCQLELPIGEGRSYRIPRYPLPKDKDEATYLRELTYKGLSQRYSDRVDVGLLAGLLKELDKPATQADLVALITALASLDSVRRERLRLLLPSPEMVEVWDGRTILARAEYELSVIEKMGFSGYFLIVQDYITWAKDKGIAVGPGRGSGAGSLVAYATRITNIDPLEFGLLFERFLNPARVSMPDFDVDFSDTRRDEVIQYVRERYGEDRVAQIATFGTMASKAALKDVARVFGMPHKQAEELAKLIPLTFGRPMPLAEAVQSIPEIREAMHRDELTARVFEVAQRLEGLNRHASVHAAGVVIANEPLMDLAPLMRDTSGSGVVVQYDMGSVESLGLLKMDLLGLRTLSFLEEARKIVREAYDEELDYDNLPLDDTATFELLSRGETKGVFQIEGAGMTSTVRALKPRRIQDIIALGALYRPGPMENIPVYIRRHHGREKVEYKAFPHAQKQLEPILRETYGIPVYQEQIMQIASAVAGYSLGEADILRRAMGKKKLEEMMEQRARFAEGALKRGVPREEADQLFDLLEAFANYGFNKSHAAAYSLLTYQTAYVKAHYPVAFMAALLSVERRDSDKVAEYIRDARTSGIPVLPPDINRSQFGFSVAGSEILFGLSAVKNVGESVVEQILLKRKRGSRFTSLADFLKHIDHGVLNRRAVESLINAGAFDAMGRRECMLDGLEALLKWAQSEQQNAASGMVGLFGAVQTEPGLPDVPPRLEVEMLRAEKDALGIYLTGHPLLRFAGLREAASCTVASLPYFFRQHRGAVRELGQAKRGARRSSGRMRVLLAGMIESISRKPTKSGGMMVRFNLADETGVVEVVVFGRAYDRVSPRIQEDQLVLAVCEVEADGEGENLRVIVRDVFPFEEMDGLPQVLELRFELDQLQEGRIKELRSLLDEQSGLLPLLIRVDGPEGSALLETREIRVDAGVARSLEGFDWLKAYTIPDREALIYGQFGGDSAQGEGEIAPF